MDTEQNKEEKGYFQLGEMWGYFIKVFRKKDPNDPTSINLRLMHGINRISIVIFLLGMLYVIIKHMF